MGNVRDSCHGQNACAHGGSSGGSIGGITRSCNEYQACYSAGGQSSRGIQTVMTDCCNSYNGCGYASKGSLPEYCHSPNKDLVHSLVVEKA